MTPWQEREGNMAEQGKKKRLFSSYISKEIYDLMEYFVKREEVTKVVFVRRAIRSFMDGDQTIEPRLRITKRTDPAYVERSCLVTVYMDEEQRELLKLVAKEQGCTMSQVFFQVILNYCAALFSLDSSGLEIKGE